LKKHQLARVLRVDKFTLAGLEATLKSYLRGQETYEIPTVRDIIESKEIILEKAQLFMNKMSEKNTAYTFKIENDTSKMVGVKMLDVEVKTYVAQLEHKHQTRTDIAKNFRKNDTSTIARGKNDLVLLAFRTMDYKDINILVEPFTEEHNKG